MFDALRQVDGDDDVGSLGDRRAALGQRDRRDAALLEDAEAADELGVAPGEGGAEDDVAGDAAGGEHEVHAVVGGGGIAAAEAEEAVLRARGRSARSCRPSRRRGSCSAPRSTAAACSTAARSRVWCIWKSAFCALATMSSATEAGGGGFGRVGPKVAQADIGAARQLHLEVGIALEAEPAAEAGDGGRRDLGAVGKLDDRGVEGKLGVVEDDAREALLERRQAVVLVGEGGEDVHPAWRAPRK